MIAKGRLGKLERFARAEHERLEAKNQDRIERIWEFLEIIDQAKVLRAKGDFDSDIVRRADQAEPILAGIIERLKNQAAVDKAAKAVHRTGKRETKNEV